jgi:GNAT superfamily N-acetyltransferase
MSAELVVRTVRDVDDPAFAAFRALPLLVYADDPSWAPASEALVSERFAEAAAGLVELHAVVALADGQPVARAVGILEPAAHDRHGRPEGWMGLFECAHGELGEEGALMVLETVRRWHGQRGAARIVGPRTDALMAGLLVEGFDQPQVVLTAHNPARYRDVLLRSGATPATELLSYRFTRDAVPTFPRLTTRGIRVRGADPDRMADEVSRLHAFQAEVFAATIGHLPRDVGGTERLVARLLPLIDPELVLLAEDRRGELVGVLICLPDAWQERPAGTRPDRARLLSIGVRAAWRRTGVALAMGQVLADRLLAGGYRSLEGAWVRRENRAPQLVAEVLRARPSRRFELLTWQIPTPLPALGGP